MEEGSRIAAVDEVLRAWLAEPDVSLMGGRWRAGAIMELVLEQGAELSPPRYDGRFAGLRDLVIPGHRHHMHLDLGRIQRVTYAVTPSVCYGFRPSFEVHFGNDLDDAVFSVTLLSPYRDRELDAPRVSRYFALLAEHASRHGSIVRFVADDGGRRAEHTDAWRAVGRAFAAGAGIDTPPESPDALGELVRSRYAVRADAGVERFPPVVRVLDQALRLAGASFVVYRARTLVELKTEHLRRRVSMYEEDGHRSWQIGAFEDHHCHLDLDSIEEVQFDAEPVSCQGGKLNWTVWFLGKSDAGNPYRPNAIGSVTLNRPYTDAGERDAPVIAAVYALFDRVREHAFVSATEGFLAAR